MKIIRTIVEREISFERNLLFQKSSRGTNLNYRLSTTSRSNLLREAYLGKVLKQQSFKSLIVRGTNLIRIIPWLINRSHNRFNFWLSTLFPGTLSLSLSVSGEYEVFFNDCSRIKITSSFGRKEIHGIKGAMKVGSAINLKHCASRIKGFVQT